MNKLNNEHNNRVKEEDVEEKHEPMYSEFALICPNCGRVFYQDYNNSQESGIIVCPYCGERYQ